jgi:hypothetical protein
MKEGTHSMEQSTEIETKPTGTCDYFGQLFERKNNHQRRFCNQDHAQAWHSEARDFGFANYVTKAKQLAVSCP